VCVCVGVCLGEVRLCVCVWVYVSVRSVCVCVRVGGRPTDELRGSSTLSGLVLCSLGVQVSAARAPAALCVHLAVICQSAPGHDFLYTS